MVQFEDFISKCLHQHTFSSMFSDSTSKAHGARILSCSGLGVGAWFTTSLVFLAFRWFFLIFCTALHMQLGLPHPLIAGISWCVYTHPIDPIGIHFLRCAQGNECTITRDAIHDTFVIIGRTFNHIQLLLLMSRLCAYQIWHSHFSWCCHCRPNENGFIFSILHNSRICCLWCSSNQGKDLS